MSGMAASVKVVNLPDGEDIRDLLKRSGPEAVRSAIDRAAPSGRPTFFNAEQITEGEETETVAESLDEILEQLMVITGGFPRRVGNQLFVHDPEHGLANLAKPAALFGYIQRFARVEWSRATGTVSRDELFAELQRTARAYRALEQYPHFPPLPGHYYAHPAITPGDGSALRELISRFSPLTPIDNDLILSLFASAVWGGKGGTKPSFTISSDHGRGVGKTTLAEMPGRLTGGAFAIKPTERYSDVVKRLLTSEAAGKRVVLADNIKQNNLSWADLEALITSTEISGHRMFQGESARPNTLLYILTLNGPSMSKDLAQRSVMIKLSKPKHDGSWETDTNALIEAKRWDILADLAAFFQQPTQQLARHTRWGTWEREVLARLPEPAEAQQVILERQAEINADDEQTSGVEDHFRQELESLGYNPDLDTVHIPNELAREWFNRATGTTHSTIGVTRAIRQGNGEGVLAWLRVNPCRTHGRGLLWSSDLSSNVLYDIAERQAAGKWRDNRYWDR